MNRREPNKKRKTSSNPKDGKKEIQKKHRESTQ